jgi:protein TonB
LAILLGASGRVERILVLKRLGYGLDEQAVKAAQQIKFEPKKKDGVPVSTVVIFDYGFNIY